MAKRRRKDRVVNLHHRKALSLGGSSGAGNVIWVDKKHHEAFHMLFGAGAPEEICDKLNRIWGDPEYKFYVTPREPTFGISYIDD